MHIRIAIFPLHLSVFGEAGNSFSDNNSIHTGRWVNASLCYEVVSLQGAETIGWVGDSHVSVPFSHYFKFAFELRLTAENAKSTKVCFH